MADAPLHSVESFVTASPHAASAHRLRVPGGWIYWVETPAGAVSSFVPDDAPAPLLAREPKPLVTR